MFDAYARTFMIATRTDRRKPSAWDAPDHWKRPDAAYLRKAREPLPRLTVQRHD